MSGPLSTYYKLRMANPQVQLPGQAPLYMPNNNQQQPVDNAMQQPQQQAKPQQTPQIDTNDPINSLASQLVTPAEREAQQQKMLRNKRRMIAWTGLFDGLRNLANLYTVSKGAAPMKFTDNPYQTIEQSFKEEQQRQDNLNNYQDRYAKQLYDLQRQGEQDQMRREAQQAQIDYNKSRIKMQEEESKRKDAYNQAKIKQAEAIASKNTEQAYYWGLVADGVPAKQAAEVAYLKAREEKARNSGGGGGSRRGSSSSQGYETIVTEGFDEHGNKYKKTVKQPRKGSSTTKSGNSYGNTKKLGL